MKSFHDFVVESSVKMTTHRNRRASNYESSIAEKLKTSGNAPDDLDTDSVAGFHPTDPDFKFKDRDGNHHNLEIKSGTQSMFGQVSLCHTENGWEVSPKTKKQKPAVSAYVERSGILHRLNHHWGHIDESPDKPDLYHDCHNGAEGVNLYYGADKNTPYIHIKDHGFFHTSADAANLGTEQLNGKFRMRCRFKDGRPILNFTTTKKDLGISKFSLDADPT